MQSGFSWTDGKPLAFVNWYTNEPYPLNRHLCAGFNSGGKWQDEPCYLKFPSICKRPLGKWYFWGFFYCFTSAIFKASLRKKWSFPLKISSVNVTNSLFPAESVIFTEEILNEKLHFLFSVHYSDWYEFFNES